MAGIVKKPSLLRRAAAALVEVLRAPSELKRYRTWVPPGHFYSPIPDLGEVKAAEGRIFAVPEEVPGVDLDAKGQFALFDKLSAYYPEMPFTEEKKQGLRYYFDNDSFCHTDAVVLYSILRYLKPGKLIEVGSGFSSAVTLDTNDLFLGGLLDLTFIEPYPERLLALLTDRDRQRIRLMQKPLQDVELDVFRKLKAGDVLFIDSTHVAKTGSDVNYIFFEILPALRDGVWIHFHDVMYPFEYPKDWVYGGRAWNEAYMLRAFLQYNGAYRIRLFNNWVHAFHAGLYEKKMPVCLRNTGGSIWIEKTGAGKG